MAEIPVAAQAHGRSLNISGYRLIRHMEMAGPYVAAQLFTKLFSNSLLPGHGLPVGLEIEKPGEAV